MMSDSNYNDMIDKIFKDRGFEKSAFIGKVCSHPIVPFITGMNCTNEDYEEARERYTARKMAEGFEIVLPKENELQIDIDSEEDYLRFQKMFFTVVNKNISGITIKRNCPSQSGFPKRHITLSLPIDINFLERIALQACLGSDNVREFLSLIRYWTGDKYPSLFVEKKL